VKCTQGSNAATFVAHSPQTSPSPSLVSSTTKITIDLIVLSSPSAAILLKNPPQWADQETGPGCKPPPPWRSILPANALQTAGSHRCQVSLVVLK
jgi:hypothetical protein